MDDDILTYAVEDSRVGIILDRCAVTVWPIIVTPPENHVLSLRRPYVVTIHMESVLYGVVGCGRELIFFPIAGPLMPIDSSCRRPEVKPSSIEELRRRSSWPGS
jgi:hypothetical protein